MMANCMGFPTPPRLEGVPIEGKDSIIALARIADIHERAESDAVYPYRYRYPFIAGEAKNAPKTWPWPAESGCHEGARVGAGGYHDH